MDGPRDTTEVFMNLGLVEDLRARPFNPGKLEASAQSPGVAGPVSAEAGGETPQPPDEATPLPSAAEPACPDEVGEEPDALLVSEPVPELEGREALPDIQAGLGRLESGIRKIATSSEQIAGEMRDMHKLYHNEFAGRLKSMQDELERYREIEKGRVFDGILGDFANIYSVNEDIIEEIGDEKLQKRLRYMFMDILQILETNGVTIQKSNPGDKRNTRHCQVIERLPTSNPALHDTISQSRKTGFYVENRSLIKEMVGIYFFVDENAENPEEN